MSPSLSIGEPLVVEIAARRPLLQVRIAGRTYDVRDLQPGGTIAFSRMLNGRTSSSPTARPATARTLGEPTRGRTTGLPSSPASRMRDGAFVPVHVARHVYGRRLDGARPHRMPRWGEQFARSWPRGEAWAAAQVWKLTRYLDFVQETPPADAVATPAPRR